MSTVDPQDPLFRQIRTPKQLKSATAKTLDGFSSEEVIAHQKPDSSALFYYNISSDDFSTPS